MKPANFQFARAASLGEAATILRAANGNGKAVAGGQSLGPMLNLRLVQPSVLVDITGIPELTQVDADADAVVVGACVTTADIEDGRLRIEELPILATVAGGVAYRAVRNRGTIGGSICHADPAGDWLPVLAALGAECVVADGRQARRVPTERFVTGAFEVALEPGELLQGIRIPRPSRNARCGYYKICRKAGEFALASAAVLLDAGRGRFRAVMGATEGRPIVIDDARALFGGMPQAGRPPRLDETAALDLLRPAGIAAPAKQRLHLTALARAAAQAITP
jgi:aerobic carbon-monoxide dehydrogenase medium subunit